MNEIEKVNLGDIESSRDITLTPSQLVIRKYKDESSEYIYAGLFDIIGKSKETYDKFIRLTENEGIFSYGNAGTNGYNEMGTFDDGTSSIEWFINLCKVCVKAKKLGINVIFEFNKELLLTDDIALANADYSDAGYIEDEDEISRVANSYAWYFKEAVERSGIAVKTSFSGLPDYKISSYKGMFKIDRKEKIYAETKKLIKDSSKLVECFRDLKYKLDRMDCNVNCRMADLKDAIEFDIRADDKQHITVHMEYLDSDDIKLIGNLKGAINKEMEIVLHGRDKLSDSEIKASILKMVEEMRNEYRSWKYD